MAAVLDTHAAIWYLRPSRELSPTALQAIRRAVGSGNPIYVSAISLVETIFLVEKGRLPLEALQRLEAGLKDHASGLVVAPVDAAVADGVYRVPRTAVPDMPDRIIAATALHLGLPLVTRDRRLQAAGIKTIW
ncbi:MAG: type II toxin-antitoxin system VapC family toxin [Candidatus Acidiferrales bacterium]